MEIFVFSITHVGDWRTFQDTEKYVPLSFKLPLNKEMNILDGVTHKICSQMAKDEE